MLDWLDQNTDLVALFLAVVGLGVSLFTVWLSIRQARLDAYTRMHEMLVSPETARGRRILYLAHAQNNLPEPGDTDWDSINQSLAVYDTLAVYMRKKIVSEPLVLSAWFHPLSAIRGPAEAWVQHRALHGVRNPWPNLAWLLERADQYHTKQGCCTEPANA
ncbi:DUF4760 domain-containing protein [Aeromicrobium sp.]|uniref:DUF4760 domain-containing protein n=1 Tax=Aeromicrobium sp. TaxID=1871063 RepID=UPI003C3FDA8E